MPVFLKEQQPSLRLFLQKSVCVPLVLQNEQHTNAALYLDVKKAGQHRDPSVGQFIYGKRANAHTKDGEEDLTSFVQDLLNQVPAKEIKG